MIIDGKSLAYALEDDTKNLFLELAISCASVICCRSSPKQKALVSLDHIPNPQAPPISDYFPTEDLVLMLNAIAAGYAGYKTC